MIVIIDSNLLHGRIKPGASGEFRIILENCRRFNWRIKVPEPVITELVCGAREKLVTLGASIQHISDTLEGYEISDIKMPPFDSERYLQTYTNTLSQFLTENDIRTIPFPTNLPKLEELFSLAAGKVPPFDKHGSFRDPIIFYSALQFALGDPSDVYFLGKDVDFIRNCRQYSGLPKNLKPRSYQEINEEFKLMLEKVDRTRISLAETELKKIALSEKRKIESVVETSLISNNPFFVGPSFELGEIENVNFYKDIPGGMSFVMGITGMLTTTSNSPIPEYRFDKLTGQNQIRKFTPGHPMFTGLPFRSELIAETKVDESGSPTLTSYSLTGEVDEP